VIPVFEKFLLRAFDPAWILSELTTFSKCQRDCREGPTMTKGRKLFEGQITNTSKDLRRQNRQIVNPSRLDLANKIYHEIAVVDISRILYKQYCAYLDSWMALKL